LRGRARVMILECAGAPSNSSQMHGLVRHIHAIVQSSIRAGITVQAVNDIGQALVLRVAWLGAPNND